MFAQKVTVFCFLQHYCKLGTLLPKYPSFPKMKIPFAASRINIFVLFAVSSSRFPAVSLPPRPPTRVQRPSSMRRHQQRRLSPHLSPRMTSPWSRSNCFAGINVLTLAVCHEPFNNFGTKRLVVSSCILFELIRYLSGSNVHHMRRS